MATGPQSERPLPRDVRVACIGNVDSGKSTLIGVLSKGQNDDGRGLARSLVLNFRHEQDNGRTSSIANELMCFSETGEQILPPRVNEPKNRAWRQMIPASSQIISFVDLCGHERYQKTTVFGFLASLVDYSLIVVGANMGVSRMTREHISLALMLRTPLLLVVTKIDLAPAPVYERTIEELQHIVSSPKAGGLVPMLITDSEEMTHVADLMDAHTVPIFSVSNVTGQGLPKLRELLRQLTSRGQVTKTCGSPDDPIEFRFLSSFMVKGVGLVIDGVVQSGTIRSGQSLILGPDGNGQFEPVIVKSIHFHRAPVESVRAGQSCSLAIKTRMTRNLLKKGMIAVEEDYKPKITWFFDSSITVVNHPTAIRKKYESVAHIGVIRQAVKVIECQPEALTPGTRGDARFGFCYKPEVLKVGSRFVLREGGRIRGWGVVKEVYDDRKMLK